jgi:hypothetical protein
MPNEEVGTAIPEATPAAPVAAPVTTPAPAPAGNQAGDWDRERERKGLIGETQKERQARQRLEGELNTLKAQHEIATKRIQALAGVNPKSEQEAEDAAIREAFASKFPHLAELTAEDIQALRDQRSQTAALKASTDAMWKKHTTQVMNSIHAKVADRLNGDVKDLTDRQKMTLRREYIAFIEENHAAGKDYVGRHEEADEALFDEFVDAYLKDWQEPIRRSVTSTEINRQRPLPTGRGRSIATTGAKSIDFNDRKKTEDAAVEIFQNLGGRFGQ